MATRDEIRRQADAIAWFHSIDLGDGITTKGQSDLALSVDRFPDFAGRSVLDIGAWDGYYSFQAEHSGAARVVALDNYAWGVDFVARERYWAECAANGTLPDHAKDLTDFWRADLPGRRGFDFAKERLHSDVTPVVGDFATMDLNEIGVFDVVMYLGVLYHMKEPLTCLERVRRVTSQVAVVETAALHVPGLEDERLLQFHPGGELNTDFGNWYVPNLAAIHALCLAAGFSSVTTVLGPPEVERGPWRRRSTHRAEVYRALVHAHV
jgi:tRNA (mo5U34)-methyltransferase